ncbi:MAG TPA: diacylglycerol kinase, partial [Actinomycetota bacterium]|nr:diacylglycerol kinase [Actinomycetota bacterium]
PTAAVILVSNGPYELQRAKGRGSRERLDDGTLGIATLTVLSASDMQKLISLEAAGRLGRFEGWREWTADRFEVRSAGRVDVGVDGEALTMDPPLVFATRPGALTIRMPRHAPGRSPAAAAVRVTERSTIRELLRIAAGKPANP